MSEQAKRKAGRDRFNNLRSPVRGRRVHVQQKDMSNNDIIKRGLDKRKKKREGNALRLGPKKTWMFLLVITFKKVMSLKERNNGKRWNETKGTH